MRMSTGKPFWHLEGKLENGSEWTIPIDESPFLVGRTDDCSLKLQAEFISRKHAEIVRRGSDLFLRDLKSTNGTFINNRRIKEEEKLRSEDIIHFGNIMFRVIKNTEAGKLRIQATSQLKIPFKVKSFMDHYSISRREEEVLFYLLQGKSTKAIGDILCISEGTAKNHILNIYKKTDVHSRFALLAIFNNFNARMS
jgi:DNA-binding CsgD family transcriptional regulator